MKNHKIQVTINKLEQPNLSEYLELELSARRRANIIKRLAELGAMLEKIGLENLARGSISSLGPPAKQIGSPQEEKVLGTSLGGDFFANALASFMPPSPHESDDGHATDRSVR